MTDRPDDHDDTNPDTPGPGPSQDPAPDAAPPSSDRDPIEDLGPLDDERDAVAIATGPVDPWAHRRGEPRIFAFLWTLFLLASVLGAIVWHGGTPAMAEYGPAARLIAVLVGIGIAVLWPVVRLSQEMPKRAPLQCGAADLMVVLVPTQLVLWPLGLLASWPLDVVLTVSGLLSVWILQTSGLLTIRYALRVRAGTTTSDGAGWWMTGFIGLFVWAPCAILAGQALTMDLPGWLIGISPLSAIFSIAGTALRGVAEPVDPLHWVGIGVVGVCGVIAWIVGILIGFRARIASGSAETAYDGRSAPDEAAPPGAGNSL